MLNFISLLGSVVAGVSNIASFIQSVAEKVQIAIEAFRVVIDAIAAPIQYAIDTALEFTTTADEVATLATLEEPLAGWLIRDIASPWMGHELTETRESTVDMLPGVAILSEAATYSNMVVAHTKAQEVVTKVHSTRTSHVCVLTV